MHFLGFEIELDIRRWKNPSPSRFILSRFIREKLQVSLVKTDSCYPSTRFFSREICISRKKFERESFFFFFEVSRMITKFERFRESTMVQHFQIILLWNGEHYPFYLEFDGFLFETCFCSMVFPPWSEKN